VPVRTVIDTGVEDLSNPPPGASAAGPAPVVPGKRNQTPERSRSARYSYRESAASIAGVRRRLVVPVGRNVPIPIGAQSLRAKRRHNLVAVKSREVV